MNKTLMAAGLAVVLGACNSSKKSDGVDTKVAFLPIPTFDATHQRRVMELILPP